MLQILNFKDGSSVGYRADWMDPIHVNLKGNISLLTFPPPGSGVLVAFVLNMLDGNLTRNSSESSFESARQDPLTYHRIAEAFKFAYAQRTKLADPLFEPSVKEVNNALFFSCLMRGNFVSAASLQYLPVSQLTLNLTSKSMAEETFAKIDDLSTFDDPAYYGATTYTPDDSGTSHISVLDGNGLAVSITSTVNLL